VEGVIVGAENFNRQFILLDFTDLDNPDFLAFTRAPEFSTYLVMRRHIWRSAEPHYMGLHDYYAKGYLACSLEREKIATLLGLSLVTISNDIQALQRRTVIESLRTGRQNIFVLGRWVRDDGANYEHFYLDRLYVRDKENLISELLAGRDKETLISDDNPTRPSAVKEPLRSNRESNRETNRERNREGPVEISRSRKTTIPKKEQGIIAEYIEDYAREFHDEASLASSAARAGNLYQRADIALEAFVEALQGARSLTKMHSANIQKQAAIGGAAFGPPKNRMAYFFAVLEDVLGLSERPERGRVDR
jgi:hypothetical protein